MTEPAVTLYSRPGCHLCDVARLQLHALQMTLPFEMRDVNIEGDEGLERRFLLEIPVIEVAGELVVQGVMDLEAVRAALIRARLGTAGQLPPRE